jgi:hypothetical protein
MQACSLLFEGHEAVSEFFPTVWQHFIEHGCEESGMHELTVWKFSFVVSLFYFISLSFFVPVQNP